ncbi:Tol-Pal system beta propeller repeat protein TolB [Methylocapsa acidiphila]|uniref:Tol-Pal system beta propeller repeat protein TolB n=1 Tax=Methylocapsa acidiphila TaxID=133552 RepID=UPI0006885F40|nr:Tol-Pal system beta propeller repeat protein TolB [Methylocapsa acidiphila]
MAGSGLAAGVAGPAAFAQQDRYLDVRRSGEFQPILIAVTGFAGEPAASAQMTGIITNNFKRSVFLSPIDPKTFVETISNPDQTPRMDAWRAINAQFIVTGRAGRNADGRLQAEFRLWDVSTGAQVAGQQYVTDAGNSRRIAHIISDAIFTRITGEGGFFDTRVVFVDETGSKENRRKRLAIMDQDGANVRYLTRGDDLVVTPRFSPSSQEVTYMSFGASDPKVLLLNIETGQREVVGNFPGMTFSPRFSPDGQKIVMSLAQGATSNLYSMDLRSRATTRLSDSSAIDTSPCYSPDGSQIAFESDRGGTQQIYVMSSSGGSPHRISFGEGRYSTPVWSPKGDFIAFTKQKGGNFGIGVMRADGSGERLLTEGYHNEGPTWAPNGLYLMFFRDPGGQAGAKIFMADVFGRGEFPVPTPSFGSDPAWSPLLN